MLKVLVFTFLPGCLNVNNRRALAFEDSAIECIVRMSVYETAIENGEHFIDTT